MLSILRWQEALDLSHNNFTHFSCNMELVWASSLKRLNLSYNKLGTISWNICQLTCLQDLDVSHNCLRRLPNEEFWTCTTLHKLNLSHNKVSSPCSKRVKTGYKMRPQSFLGSFGGTGQQTWRTSSVFLSVSLNNPYSLCVHKSYQMPTIDYFEFARGLGRCYVELHHGTV